MRFFLSPSTDHPTRSASPPYARSLFRRGSSALCWCPRRFGGLCFVASRCACPPSGLIRVRRRRVRLECCAAYPARWSRRGPAAAQEGEFMSLGFDPSRVGAPRVGPIGALVGAATLVVALTFGSAWTQAPAASAAGATPIDLSLELRPSVTDRAIPNSQSAAHVPAAHVPRPESKQVASTNPGFSGFLGLTHRDQRLADSGNQFSLEPPDQGLCVGGGRVIDTINTVFAVYDATTGAKLSPASGGTSLTLFFTGQHQVQRPPLPRRFGPFLSDPKCYFDPALGRFFMTVVELDQNPVTGAFDGRAATLLAVSKTATPTTSSGDWFIYSIDPTNDATKGTPSHPGCPCFGDQPLIGADANAFVITTNEFNLSFFAGAPIVFNGAQIYVIDKAGAAAGALRFQFIGGWPPPPPPGPAASPPLPPSPTPHPASAEGGPRGPLSPPPPPTPPHH